MQEENLNLRLRLKVGDEAEDAENAEILEIKERLRDMVSKGVGEGQILQTMDLLTERFADYGRWKLKTNKKTRRNRFSLSLSLSLSSPVLSFFVTGNGN